MSEDAARVADPVEPPFVSVVKGTPTAAELAALVAVLSAATTRTRPAASTVVPSGWSAYRRSVRTPLVPGPDAWRSSGRRP